MLVALGFFESRASAQAAIEAGLVSADGNQVSKPSQQISADAEIKAQPAHPYVSRAALKLEHGLKIFGVSPVGRVCLDIGASTGGFTQILLNAGAARVYAVDVGRGQLHESLRGVSAVVSMEARDARSLTADDFSAPPSLIVCDASFIALEKLLGPALSLAAADADLVCLFKPQFQVGQEHVGKGGIVNNLEAAAKAETAFEDWLNSEGWRILGWTDSPIKGGDGNAERLFHARRS